MTPVVLVLTHPADVHADAVTAHLETLGVDVHRVDTAALGTAAAPVTMHLRNGVVSRGLAGCDLSSVVGAWHRRPSQFIAANPGDEAELRAGIGGILADLPYLNHPADMAVASFKPLQLSLAARYGLPVPETMITTDRSAATAMAERLRDAVVVKPISRTVARLVSADDRSGWDQAMHLTQQRISTNRHIRLTVVDGTMFAVEITSPHLDWRREPDACRYRPVVTPGEISGAVRQLLAALRLRFAALDFAVDLADRWWFLEVNPNGQWLWIEHATGLPVAATVATALRNTAPARVVDRKRCGVRSGASG